MSVTDSPPAKDVDDSVAEAFQGFTFVQKGPIGGHDAANEN